MNKGLAMFKAVAMAERGLGHEADAE